MKIIRMSQNHLALDSKKKSLIKKKSKTLKLHCDFWFNYKDVPLSLPFGSKNVHLCSKNLSWFLIL